MLNSYAAFFEIWNLSRYQIMTTYNSIYSKCLDSSCSNWFPNNTCLVIPKCRNPWHHSEIITFLDISLHWFGFWIITSPGKKRGVLIEMILVNPTVCKNRESIWREKSLTNSNHDEENVNYKFGYLVTFFCLLPQGGIYKWHHLRRERRR